MRGKYTLVAVIALVSSTRQVQPIGVSDGSAALALSKGNELLNKGDYEKARQYYDAAIARNPKGWESYLDRARVFVYQQKWDLALQDLNIVLRLQPSVYLAALMRASINQRLGKFSSSLAEYENLLNWHPRPWTRASVLNGKAWLRATCLDGAFRNGQQAVEDAKAACNLTSWRKPYYIDTLAVAYAELGDFDSAVRFEQQALAHEQDENHRKTYEQHLTQFHAHQPVRGVPK